ncbi:hypothetical protein PHYBLDRAFT_148629 [Phycomyces blakesleeanus NRRL 1555(-)]|uniref:MULE transposase domain-containing protein n=1 Tax=Phycomyces blakesleeanus (strain ATCC 8743b / DSM 1359 / FGSC 10004 / NBRC 33097 / NRRL 1555) TaxID=763407 RepID=A0A162TPK8_PHYB8|nr:hypothetical protein PHYBLDRAFT_148629 [Phycomyces blakesleeanus NRRL 1555(-)]OAD70062.1 hypothetical protein PHYBLDRAFT_148629 [Phycomyces blakesleeanus NRRL 1555(-)]|eukprot:XP_018288102.1 hypothetical protein PHYBLDRAFT_148629 [Phycomyces blakesleeanus NRRL 1555(-)]
MNQVPAYRFLNWRNPCITIKRKLKLNLLNTSYYASAHTEILMNPTRSFFQDLLHILVTNNYVIVSETYSKKYNAALTKFNSIFLIGREFSSTVAFCEATKAYGTKHNIAFTTYSSSSTFSVNQKTPISEWERQQLEPEAIILVVQHLEENDDVSTIFNNLKRSEYTSFICQDIKNIKQQFRKPEEGREIFSFITALQELDFYVRYSIGDNKTNSHQMTYVNIVDISNVSGTPHTTMKTFPIAGAWVDHKTIDNYLWVLFCLHNSVWPDVNDSSSSYTTTATLLLPSVFITDNEKALRNAITNAFPECKQLLCYKHIKNNFKKQLLSMMKKDKNGDKRDFLNELASYLDQITLKCTTSKEEKKEIDAYLRFAKDNCKDQEKSTKAFLESILTLEIALPTMQKVHMLL